MEPLTQTSIIAVQDSTQVAVARRAAAEIAQAIDLPEDRISAVSVVAVELANNLLQHAGGGKIYVQYLPPTGALDIAAIDHGKGMANVDQCVQDGFSTGSSPGLGLGAVRRFAKRFSLYSIQNRCTVISARMAEDRASPNFSVVSTAIPGESVTGDGWSVSKDGLSFLVVDGLGHGLLAAAAAQAGIELFLLNQKLPPKAILERMHQDMRATRGAAAAIAHIEPGARKIHFAGIGNISCVLHTPNGSRSFVSHNGTLGHHVRGVQELEYAYRPGDTLLMHSDGLTASSKQGVPVLLMSESPSVIAPFVFSERFRGHDDATLLVNRLD